MALDITGSIVLYHTEVDLLQKAIDSFLNTKLAVKLYLIDNSSNDNLKDLAKDERITYIFNNRNLGFGAAHNIAIDQCKTLSKYHLVLNPDVEFGPGVLEAIKEFMDHALQVGQLIPKVLYKEGELQRSCRLLPTPFDLVRRRFFKNNTGFMAKQNERYELGMFSHNERLNAPNLSGCFMFLRNSILNQTGGFDTRYFMYMEDVDLTRRVHALSETVFFPDVFIYHGYSKGSYSNSNLLKYHIQSALKYYNKWGWIFDRQRSRFNKQVLKRINEAR